MNCVCLNDNGREEWNAFAARQPHFSLLQSWEWGEFKKELGWKAHRIAVKQDDRIVAGAQLVTTSLWPGLASVAYVPRGPLGIWLDQEVAAGLLSEIHRFAQDQRAVFLKIEPPLLNLQDNHRILRDLGFKGDRPTIQPRATIILNLDMPLENILMQIRRKTRQYIGLARREGITVRVGGQTDFQPLYYLLRKACQRGRLRPRSYRYFEQSWRIFFRDNQAALLMAYHENRLIAVRTVYRFGSHAAEFHAGSICDRGLHPNYLLVWEAIQWAKKSGCRTYDLWGIPDEVGDTAAGGGANESSDRTDGLWGVYRFKRGFSRNVVSYVGAYDYVYRPFFYSLIANKLINLANLERAAVYTELLRNR